MLLGLVLESLLLLVLVLGLLFLLPLPSYTTLYYYFFQIILNNLSSIRLGQSSANTELFLLVEGAYI